MIKFQLHLIYLREIPLCPRCNAGFLVLRNFIDKLTILIKQFEACKIGEKLTRHTRLSNGFDVGLQALPKVAVKLLLSLMHVAFDCDFVWFFELFLLLLQSDGLKRLACLADCHRLTRFGSCSQHLNESLSTDDSQRARER